jgi:uncharacterized Rossmann fold enzyme
MRFSEWEPVYREILADMGYDRLSDEMSVRLLKVMLTGSDVIDDDELGSVIGKNVVITGGAGGFTEVPEADTLIATGSSIPLLLSMGIVPDIIVTDLDGDTEAQKRASAEGAVTVIHAHGDNADAIMKHAKEFSGKVVMTTQSVPEWTVYNFGGFTDGDRAVCMAGHLGAENISLAGFDLGRPSEKPDSDTGLKMKKLRWAERIISMQNGVNIVFL